MFKIDQCAYSNNLRNTHPAEKFAFAIITTLICLAFSRLETSLAIVFLMAFLTIFIAGINWKLYLKLLSLPFGFLLIGIATIVVSLSLYPCNFILYTSVGKYYIGVQPGNLHLAVNIFFKALGTLTCLYFLALTTPMTEIIMVLKKLRVPALFIELMTLIYRFIFVLLETAGKIYLSQNSRWGYASLKSSYRSLGILISNLFSRAYWRSKVSFTALVSRGYSGNINVLEPEFSMSARNIALISLTEILLLLLGLYGRGII